MNIEKERIPKKVISDVIHFDIIGFSGIEYETRQNVPVTSERAIAACVYVRDHIETILNDEKWRTAQAKRLTKQERSIIVSTKAGLEMIANSHYVTWYKDQPEGTVVTTKRKAVNLIRWWDRFKRYVLSFIGK